MSHASLLPRGTLSLDENIHMHKEGGDKKRMTVHIVRKKYQFVPLGLYPQGSTSCTVAVGECTF